MPVDRHVSFLLKHLNTDYISPNQPKISNFCKEIVSKDFCLLTIYMCSMSFQRKPLGILNQFLFHLLYVRFLASSSETLNKIHACILSTWTSPLNLCTDRSWYFSRIHLPIIHLSFENLPRIHLSLQLRMIEMAPLVTILALGVSLPQAFTWLMESVELRKRQI